MELQVITKDGNLTTTRTVDLDAMYKARSYDCTHPIYDAAQAVAAMIKEDMDYMGPVRMKDVEEAQQKVVNIIRKLEDAAEIVISRGGGDEIIV